VPFQKKTIFDNPSP